MLPFSHHFSSFSDLSLPENCTFEQAALAEPLSVVLHASRRAELSPGQSVLVFGVGPIGMLVCAYAKSQGASRIAAIDINQARLDFAKANGFASHTFCLPKTDNTKTTEDQLRRMQTNVQIALTEFCEPDGFDLVFECSGAESSIQMSVHVSFSRVFCGRSAFIVSFCLPSTLGCCYRR